MDPTQTADLFTALIDLIPVVGGAAIGVLGGLGGTAYAHRLSFTSSKNAELRTKLETLVTEAYELEVWLKKQENYYLYGGPETLEQSPVAKIEALAAMYFHALDGQVSALSNADNIYRSWLLAGAQLRLSANSATPPKEHLDKLPEVYGPLIVRKKDLIKATRCLMRELFGDKQKIRGHGFLREAA